MDAADIETEEPPGAAGAARAGHEQARASAPAAEVDILDPDRLVAAPALRWLVDHARAAADALSAAGEVRVRIVDDAAMAAAHERYSNVPGTTDVLTFDLRRCGTGVPPVSSAPLDVDILICADEARRQAAPRGIPLEHELLLYIVHGMLHCLGEDDHDEVAGVRMHQREDRVLTAIGVGPVYARTIGASG
jgi:probable rRNA maturation factor